MVFLTVSDARNTSNDNLRILRRCSDVFLFFFFRGYELTYECISIYVQKKKFWKQYFYNSLANVFDGLVVQMALNLMRMETCNPVYLWMFSGVKPTWLLSASPVEDRSDLSMSGCNTEILTLNNCWWNIWKVSRFLHTKDIFCRCRTGTL